MISFNTDTRISAKAGQAPKISILAYAGGIMSVAGFGPLVIDLQGLTIPQKVSLLADHKEKLSAVIGQGRPQIIANQLFVEGVLAPEAPASQQILSLHASGVELQASVGVRPGESERLKPGTKIRINGREILAGSKGLLVIRSGELREISIVVFGADDETVVSIAAKFSERGLQMPDASKTDVIENPVLKERERITKISALCGVEGGWGSQQKLVDNLQAKAIAEEISVEVLQGNLLEVLRASRPTAPRGQENIQAGDLSRKHLSAAIMVKAGAVDTAVKAYGQGIVDQCDQMGLHDTRTISAAALRLDGQDVPHRESEIIKAAASTISLPIALGDSMNRQLEFFYREAPASWEVFSRKRTAANFHDQKSVRPSYVGGLDELGADGTLKHGELSEAVFTWSVATFGKIMGITRRDIVNDSLGLFDETLPALAQAAKRKFSDLVWATILDGSGSHFSAGNGNLGEAGSALSLDSLEAAVISMMIQRDDEGNDLDMLPKYLAVSPELKVTAQAILESIELNAVEGSPTGNALRNVTELVVEPRLSNTTKFNNASTTQWYLFTDANSVPVIAATLDETPFPIVEIEDEEFSKLGKRIRVYQDFGCALGDHRAGYKATGAS